jgi:hypothetical protein
MYVSGFYSDYKRLTQTEPWWCPVCHLADERVFHICPIIKLTYSAGFTDTKKARVR